MSNVESECTCPHCRILIQPYGDFKHEKAVEASKELESAGLALGDQAEEYSDDVESGKIIRLNGIEPGKKIQAGSMINVVVSLGPED